jgi:hypothetical protein
VNTMWTESSSRFGSRVLPVLGWVVPRGAPLILRLIIFKWGVIIWI